MAPSPSSSSFAASCPCCMIFLPQNNDLFLPPSLRQQNITPSSSTTTRPKKKHDNDKKNNNQPSSGDNNELLLLHSPHEALAEIIKQNSNQSKILKQPKTEGNDQQTHDNRNNEDNNNDDDELLLLVDTHGHAHLNRPRHASYILDQNDDENNDESSSVALLNGPTKRMISLSCSVHPRDWTDCLNYASQSKIILPGLGIHPWYLEDLVFPSLSSVQKQEEKDGLADADAATTAKSQNNNKKDDDEVDMKGYHQALERLETLLQSHPHAIVGEIGLCKVAKWVRTFPKGKALAMDIQRRAFVDQFKLAARHQRPVSVHCVNQHGVLFQTLQSLQQDEFPPAIAMHSFTGTAHHVKQLLRLESKTTRFYFGFSHVVNYEMCSSAKSKRQGIEAIRAVPQNLLLAESDVHSPVDVAIGTAGAVAYLASALDRTVAEVAAQTTQNGIAFLNHVFDGQSVSNDS